MINCLGTTQGESKGITFEAQNFLVSMYVVCTYTIFLGRTVIKPEYISAYNGN